MVKGSSEEAGNSGSSIPQEAASEQDSQGAFLRSLPTPVPGQHNEDHSKGPAFLLTKAAVLVARRVGQWSNRSALLHLSPPPPEPTHHTAHSPSPGS